MKMIKNIGMLSITLFSITGVQAINTPGFIKKFFPDKTAEYYEKKDVPFSKRSEQLKEYIRLLNLYVDSNNEQAAIPIAQKIVASPLLTREEKMKFAQGTGERIIRKRPPSMEPGSPLNEWLQSLANQVSEKIYPRGSGHSW